MANVRSSPLLQRASELSAVRARNDLQAAIVAGQLAALAMMGALALAFKVGRGVFLGFPLQAAAAVLLGDRALGEPTASVLFVGAVAHQLGPALFWSLVYGVLAASFEVRGRPLAAALLGLFVGAVAMVVDVYLLLPPISRAFAGSNEWTHSIPRAWDWSAHLLYGGALGFFFVDKRDRLSRGARAQRPL